MWNMFKVIIRHQNDRATSLMSFWHFIVKFEHISHHILFFFLCRHKGPPPAAKMPWGYFTPYSNVCVFDLEQVITGGVTSFKQIVLYLWWTSHNQSYLIGKNLVKSDEFLVRWRKYFGLFYNSYYLYDLFFLTIFLPFRGI